MHIIYKSIRTESFNFTLIRHDDKIKVFLKRSVFHFGSAKCRSFLSKYGALLASVNNLLSLLSLLQRAALKTLSHMSSQYEIMVGIPVSLSVSSQDGLGQMIDNALLF